LKPTLVLTPALIPTKPPLHFFEDTKMAKTILFVEDSASVRQVMKTALSREGYDVILAVDGKDALTKLDGTKIHLIISDVNMPNMDGITFVKEAKKLPAYKFTPIIMLTTETQASKMAEGKAAGVKAWIVKPFQPPQLMAAVAQLVMA
jgi:two-component system chemotaxis response regulator CheY